MSTEIMTPKQEKQSGIARPQKFIKPYYEVDGDNERYEVRVMLPGVSRDGVGITLEKSELIIEGHREFRVAEDWKTLHQEIPTGDYQLRLQLNVEIDEEKIKARTENGILTIELPVAAEAKPRTIEVN